MGEIAPDTLRIADDEGMVIYRRSYELGIGQVDLLTSDVSYFHADQIGSTRLLSDAAGAMGGRQVYSAFGERATSEEMRATRYQYAGSWGYEAFSLLSAAGSPLPARLLHVGFRTYDPAIGRFLQRDPIGLRGGINVYEYVKSNPLHRIDPWGRRAEDTKTMEIIIKDAKREGKSHQEAMDEIVASHGCAFGAAIGSVIAAPAIPHITRWLNKGKFRIGPSKHKGKWRISIRWKQKHWDVPWIQW